jgi:hypothetical protein
MSFAKSAGLETQPYQLETGASAAMHFYSVHYVQNHRIFGLHIHEAFSKHVVVDF